MGTRCDNIHNILKYSQTFELSNKIDLACSSHHTFILGDLNFRTKIELNKIKNEAEHLNDSVNTSLVDNDLNDEKEIIMKKKKLDQDTNVDVIDKNVLKKKKFELVMNLIEAKDWVALYSYDELYAGLERKDLLM